MSWVPVSILANLALPDPVFAGPIAIAAANDPIVVGIRQASPHFDGFVSRFKDEFGHRRQVSVLLRDGSRHPGFTAAAIAGFRDAVALSVVLFNRAKNLTSPQLPVCLWTDYFDLYPWRVADDHQYAICGSPVLRGFHETTRIDGVVTPGVPQPSFSDGIWYFDAPLRHALLDRWSAHFIDGGATHESRSLFRSLNMAFAAARAPAGPELGVYDVGRTLALWVSALEILFHSGGRKIRRSDVIRRFDEFKWQSEILFSRCQKVASEKGAYKEINFVHYLLEKLYTIRNDFTHGNAIDVDTLRVSFRRSVLMHSLAFPLYRMGLKIALSIPERSPSFPLQFDRQLSHEDERRICQGWYEEALTSAFRHDENA